MLSALFLICLSILNLYTGLNNTGAPIVFVIWASGFCGGVATSLIINYLKKG